MTTREIDTELLMRQLRHRLVYLSRRIATEEQTSQSRNPITQIRATGALVELEGERNWLTNLIQQIENGEENNND